MNRYSALETVSVASGAAVMFWFRMPLWAAVLVASLFALASCFREEASRK